jgi:flagellar biosynthesis/type III secretory pathway M-ring protein FliF/YscJ
MEITHIPAINYVFVSITAGVLAYVTAKSQEEPIDDELMTEEEAMEQEEEEAMEQEEEEPIEEEEEEPIEEEEEEPIEEEEEEPIEQEPKPIGGKKKNKRKHKTRKAKKN